MMKEPAFCRRKQLARRSLIGIETFVSQQDVGFQLRQQNT